MSSKDVADTYRKLAKEGIAELKIRFRAGPEDEEFGDIDPVADVAVFADDPVTVARFAGPKSQMSKSESEFEAQIKILDVRKAFLALWDRIVRNARPSPYTVTITVTPHPGWAHQYLETVFHIKDVSLGRNPVQHVWLDRKIPKLDKPRLK